MLRLRGCPALSPFRRDRLLERLPGVAEVHAEHWYVVALSRDLAPAERARLGELLEEAVGAAPEPSGERIIVAPRLGTVSPWASKATFQAPGWTGSKTWTGSSARPTTAASATDG